MKRLCMGRIALLTCLAIGTAATSATEASAQSAPEQPKIHLAAAGVGFPYLPFVIASSHSAVSGSWSQTGRKTNFFNARQPAKTSMPKDMRRVYS